MITRGMIAWFFGIGLSFVPLLIGISQNHSGFGFLWPPNYRPVFLDLLFFGVVVAGVTMAEAFELLGNLDKANEQAKTLTFVLGITCLSLMISHLFTFAGEFEEIRGGKLASMRQTVAVFLGNIAIFFAALRIKWLSVKQSQSNGSA